MVLIFFLTVADSYNERSDSYNYRRQLWRVNWQW